MNKVLIFFMLFTLTVIVAEAQSPNIPLSRDYYQLLERYEIMSGKFSADFHSVSKPYQRMYVGAFIDSLYSNTPFYIGLNDRDKFNLDYLATDNYDWTDYGTSDSKKPFLKYFYQKKPDLLNVNEDDFYLHVNPVIYFSGGKESASDITTYINTRGVELSGSIAKRLGFYSFLSTTQAVYPEYVRNWTAENGVVPGEGFWKKFKSNGVDYFTARGYVSFELVKKYVNMEFGYDQSFSGSGHRSMVLSDFGPGYTYLKFNTKIWRINYTNLFIQGFADQYYSATGSLDGTYPKKFIASHHLSINITDNFNLGLFETVIMGDTTQQFNISYLNPVIFYRALEHQGGSSDNVIVGMDFKWNFKKALSFYGQVALDEFYLAEVKSGDGWWANKFGGQLGGKYINVAGIDNLDLQLEYNIARPYLHAHQDIYTNYANYRQPLGHPYGGNFKELVTIIKYQPFNRVYLTAQINTAKYGDDNEGSNWGKNVMLSYDTREQDYGNVIGQGVATNLLYGELTISYMWKHNLFFDLTGVYRKLDSELDTNDSKTTYFSGSMRWNIARKQYDF